MTINSIINVISVCLVLVSSMATTAIASPLEQPLENQPLNPTANNDTITEISKQLCMGCTQEALEFLAGHNIVRAKKGELPLAWDPKVESYARNYANERKRDCALRHSDPQKFELGECIFWGGGASWTPNDAVSGWAEEEKYYHYDSNTCDEGKMCGHYTQLVWNTTRKLGCARVVCDKGDVFITCNYSPPGNYIGDRPY